MEAPKFIERPAVAVLNAGRFIVERLFVGGGWSNLPHAEPGPARPPVRANITYYSTPEAPDTEREV